MKKITLYDTLPHSLKGNNEIKAICDSLQPILDAQWRDVDLIAIYKNIDYLPGEIIDNLAYEFHVDFYKQSWELNKKRALVKNAIKYHRYKGTPWAVEDFISTIFSKSWVKEWFEYGGNPYFFKIYTENIISDEEQLNFFYEALYTIKNSRSWLECFIVIRKFLNMLYVGGSYSVFKKYRFSPNKFDGMKDKYELYIGTTSKTLKKEYFDLNIVDNMNESYEAFQGVFIRELYKKRYSLNKDGLDEYFKWR